MTRTEPWKVLPGLVGAAAVLAASWQGEVRGQTPLSITTNLPSQISAQDGEEIRLQVGITGGPAFYTWFKNGATASTQSVLRIN